MAMISRIPRASATLLITVLVVWVPLSHAQNVPDRDDPAKPKPAAQEPKTDASNAVRPEIIVEEPPPLSIGLQLTPQVLDNLLDKAAQRLAKDWHLDEYQREQVRMLLGERIPAFLMEHQGDLQQVLNEYTAAISGSDPPDSEFVIDWAERSLPLLDNFRVLIADMTDDAREFLTDEQQVYMDGHLAMLDTVANFGENRLRLFADGGFVPEQHWPGSKHFKPLERSEVRELRRDLYSARNDAIDRMNADRSQPGDAPERVARNAAPGKSDARGTATSQPAAKQSGDLDDWDLYVKNFILRYKLNDEQIQKAEQLLKQAKERRDQYLSRKGRDMTRVEKMYADANTDEKIRLADVAYAKLNQPVERIFEQLKEKLDTLPTRAQRREAAQTTKVKRVE